MTTIEYTKNPYVVCIIKEHIHGTLFVETISSWFLDFTKKMIICTRTSNSSKHIVNNISTYIANKTPIYIEYNILSCGSIVAITCIQLNINDDISNKYMEIIKESNFNLYSTIRSRINTPPIELPPTYYPPIANYARKVIT